MSSTARRRCTCRSRPTSPGAFHAAEVPYLFPDQQFLAASTPDQRRLSDQMIRYWADFFWFSLP
jgi:carboxylesterase type B